MVLTREIRMKRNATFNMKIAVGYAQIITSIAVLVNVVCFESRPFPRIVLFHSPGRRASK